MSSETASPALLFTTLLLACGAGPTTAAEPVVVHVSDPPAVAGVLDCASFDSTFEPVLDSELGIALPNRQAFVGTDQAWDAEWNQRLKDREAAIQRFLEGVRARDLRCLLHAFTHRYPANGNGLAWNLAARVLTRACVPRTELQHRSWKSTAAWRTHGYAADYLTQLLDSTVDDAEAQPHFSCGTTGTGSGPSR